MNIALLTQTLTVIEVVASEPDVMGNITYVPSGEETDYPGVLQRTAANEIVVGRDTSITNWKAFMPPSAIVGSKDRIRVEGFGTFRVVGVPYPAQRLGIGTDHLELSLQLIGG